MERFLKSVRLCRRVENSTLQIIGGSLRFIRCPESHPESILTLAAFQSNSNQNHSCNGTIQNRKMLLLRFVIFQPVMLVLGYSVTSKKPEKSPWSSKSILFGKMTLYKSLPMTHGHGAYFFAKSLAPRATNQRNKIPRGEGPIFWCPFWWERSVSSHWFNVNAFSISYPIISIMQCNFSMSLCHIEAA